MKEPGGAGTTKLATLRDDKSWIPWKNYWLCTLFAIRGRAFPIAPMLAYSCWVSLVVVIIKWRVDDFSKYKELLALQYPVQTIGLALFLLLTFRTQTAYDRWWEGRKAWAGVINHTLDLNRIAQAWVGDSAMATKLITWCTVFAIALKQTLHYSRDMAEVSDMLTIGEMRKMMAYDDLPLYAISQASDLLREIGRTDSKAEKMMVEADKRMNRLLGEMCACLRIRNTPMPWAYVVHLRAFLVLWLLILPLAFITTLHWYTIPLSILVGYELLGYEEIGVEIENPFGTNFSDLPLEGLTATIFTNAQHFLHRIRDRDAPDKPAAKMHGAPLSSRTQSAAQLKSHYKSEVQLKERSQSAVASAHMLSNKEALKCMTEHHQEQCQQKLYDRLGGHAAVQAAVDIFYKKLLGDDRIAHFFNGISMERLKAKQVKFLTYALGGEDEYVGKDPTISHRRLHNQKGLRVTHFYIVVGHLQDTLRELGVAEALIDECSAVLAPMEKTFVCGDEYPCVGHKPERQDSAKVPMANEAELRCPAQCEAEPKDHDKSEVQLKERSQSAVAAAHTLSNKEALKCMTQHHQEQCQQKLYDRLGGHAAVEAAVDIFYKKLLGDVRVAHFFSGISMDRLRAKQVRFLTYALGGEEHYIGKDPTISHRRLHNEKGLRVTHFYIVVGHLQDTLRELGVAEELIDECTAELAPMEKTFICGEDYPCIGHMPDSHDPAKVMIEAKAAGNDAKEERETCPF